jgi:hypothetical protein
MNLPIGASPRSGGFALGPRGIPGDLPGGDAAGKRQFFGLGRDLGARVEVIEMLPSL